MLRLTDMLRNGATVVVHCSTEEEAVEFIQLAHDEVALYRTWKSAKIAWDAYGPELCFRITGKRDELDKVDLGCCSIKHYKQDGYQIHEAASFLRKNQEIKIDGIEVDDISIEDLF